MPFDTGGPRKQETECRPWPWDKPAQSTAEALFAEFREVWGDLPSLAAAESKARDLELAQDGHRQRKGMEEDMLAAYRNATIREGAPPQAALCLSGGGIRSAAFALGVMQGLARKGLLTKFHYLSTVSGGGYIGGWLSRWCKDELEAAKKRAADAQLLPAAARIAAARAAEPVEVMRGIERELARSDTREPAPIRRLREVTNFLTPEVGASSVDTWTGAVLYLRNVLLNWAVFLPALMLLALVPNLFARGMDVMEGAASGAPLTVSVLLLAFAVAALFGGLYWACRYLPSHRLGGPAWMPPRGTARDRKGAAHGPVVLGGLGWAFGLALALGAVSGFDWWGAALLEAFESIGWIARLSEWCEPLGLLPPAVYSPLVPPTGPHRAGTVLVAGADPRMAVAIGVGTLACAVSLAAYGAALLSAWNEDRKAFVSANIGYWACASVFGGALLAAGCVVLWRLRPEWQFDVLTAVGPLWVVAACLAQSSLYAGIRLPRPSGDDDREWIARVSAVCLQVAVAWGLVAAACLLLPRFLWDHYGDWSWSSGAVATASALFSAFGGASRWSAAKKVMTLRGTALNVALAVAAVIAIAVLLAALSRAQVDFLIAHFSGDGGGVHWQDTLFDPLVVWAVLLLIVVGLVSSKVGVNRFSLHGVYRNRLARAFLGSAHDGRQPHPFTGFDSGDNPCMWELATGHGKPRPAGETPRRVLFPVVNVALNLTKSTRLAWQERKAMSFTITPLACGSAELHPDTPTYRLNPAQWRDPCKLRLGAYVPSRLYGGPEVRDESYRFLNPMRPPEGRPPFTGSPPGITLATAMTISGAAASPNMGYHSTKATAFLMTLFNVRLGAWLGNPAHPEPELWQRHEPRYGFAPMFRELTGQADERGAYVYLSDGGHFDNLGIYEMVRRRCRFIVVSDAGCDSKCSFEDLGGTVRKCLIDQNVDIRFAAMHIAARSKVGKDTVAFAIGRITYPEGGPEGTILYIKPTYLEKLPVDVRAYGEANADFPHETTGDQWFSESQFESYRRLGLHIMSQLGGDMHYDDLAGFFNSIQLSTNGKAAWPFGVPGKLKIEDIVEA